MKKLLVLILAINLIQTGFCQTGGLFTKESLIEMKKRELQKLGYKEINVHYYFCGCPVTEKAMVGLSNCGEKLQIVLTLSVPTIADLSASSFIPAQWGYVENNESYTNSIQPIERSFRYKANIAGRSFYFNL